jgi:hypothetical protein
VTLPIIILALAGGLVILIVLLIVGLKIRKRRNSRPQNFRKKWNELQKFCANRETWPLAVISADKLLDEALKKRRLKGKSMGERLVSAQRRLNNNDGVWYAHNLAKKLKDSTANVKLREGDVKKALIGVRQAMRDLGVLVDGK